MNLPGTAYFRVPIYGGRVVLCKERAVYSGVLEYLKHPPQKEVNSAAALASMLEYPKDRALYLVGNFDKNPRTFNGSLIHELSHLTFWILERAVVRVTPANNEAFAYLMDELYKQSVKALRRIKPEDAR